MDGGQFWEVVGGVGRGGILVRQGSDVTSAEEGTRLSTGATVRELELIGGRLHYELVTGTGPPSGWVSVKVPENKVLLVRIDGKQAAEQVAPGAGAPAAAAAKNFAAGVGGLASGEPQWTPVTGRKIRVLAVHSAPANSNFMKFQTTQLRKAFGKEAEWLFVDAPNPWEPRPFPPGHREGDPVSPTWLIYGGERSELDQRLAGNKPFVEWLCFDEDARRPSAETARLSQEHLEDYVRREAPIDVAVAISQGTCVLMALVEAWRAAGREPPWRLSVLFNYVPPEWHHVAPEPAEPCSHPVVAILGGERDPWTAIGEPALRKRYADLTVLSHEDGHCFPIAEPLAGEIYGKVAAMVRSRCGLSEPGK